MTPAPSVLAQALTRSMTSTDRSLAVLDTGTGTWNRHPWGEVHDRAQNVAAHLCDGGVPGVGLVGDPTVEFIAAIPGAFLAGAAVSILPGPVRGADPKRWARATLDRFAAIGVRTVLQEMTPLPYFFVNALSALFGIGLLIMGLDAVSILYRLGGG